MARPLESLLINPNPDVPRTKSLLARLASPLAKRTGKSFELEIALDQAYKTYGPGESVRGQILLHMYKGLDITHLTVSLHGTAVVFKHQCSPGETQPIPELLLDRQGSHGFEYHGNGMASLFQDERVLAGSGFLKRGSYQFNFDLEFPPESLPSALEFERGAISYMIRATVTRPTTIMPRTTKMCKVNFQDCIDIESMYKPKSRGMTMEPVTRRGKVKKVKTASVAETQAPSSTKAPTRRRNTSTSDATSVSPIQPLTDNPPPSPAPSENTAATAASQSTQSLEIPGQQSDPSKASPRTSEPRSSITSNSVQTINTMVELSRHGALPGDSIPVRVLVSHTKPARGIVIATLCRIGHVDMYPALPLAARGKKHKAEYEDVYPKSRTGLGGLYFTNSTPNMSFRKDLSQTSTMMIVDPETLMADVRFSIRVPQDTFPSITNISKQMIHFEYFVEVVVDVTGKLNETPLLPSLTTTGPIFTSTAQAGFDLTTDWANHVLDTAPMRRTKAVAVFNLPLVVGTKDSRRQRQRELEKSRLHMSGQQSESAHYGVDEHDIEQYWDQNYSHGQHADENQGWYSDQLWYDEHGNPMYNYHDPYYDAVNHPIRDIPHYIPPPEPEEHRDEKSRLRRQEELLLPSAPPDAESSSSSAPPATAPSAPTVEALDDSSPLTAITHSSNTPQTPVSIMVSRASARSADTIVPEPPITPPPSLPDETLHGTEPESDSMEAEQTLRTRHDTLHGNVSPTDGQDKGNEPGPRPGHINAAQLQPGAASEAEEDPTTNTPEQNAEHLPEYKQ